MGDPQPWVNRVSPWTPLASRPNLFALGLSKSRVTELPKPAARCTVNSRARTSILLMTLLTLACAVRTAPASTFTLTFERAIPAPDDNTFALDVAGDGTLWAHGLTTHTFYQLDPLTGGVLRSFPGDGSTVLGIGLSGGTIDVALEPTIERFDVATGTQLSSITGPVVGGSRGLTFIAGKLYVLGVLAGFPGEVRLGRVDPATGALLSSCAPPNAVYSQVIGRIGPFACYITTDGPTTLRIVDADSGALIEDHVLFAGSDFYYGAFSSATEQFVTPRDLGQIWVYSLDSPVATRKSSWGAIHALYR